MTRISLGAKVGAEIDNDDRIRVLSVIDQLRTLGLSDDVSLPQVLLDVIWEHFLTIVDRGCR